jgi:hypothetical protein
VIPWTLAADTSGKDEYLIGKFLWKPNNTNMLGSWMLKFIFCIKDNLWTVALRQIKLGAVKYHTYIPTNFIWIIIFLDDS